MHLRGGWSSDIWVMRLGLTDGSCRTTGDLRMRVCSGGAGCHCTAEGCLYLRIAQCAVRSASAPLPSAPSPGLLSHLQYLSALPPSGFAVCHKTSPSHGLHCSHLLTAHGEVGGTHSNPPEGHTCFLGWMAGAGQPGHWRPSGEPISDRYPPPPPPAMCRSVISAAVAPESQ